MPDDELYGGFDLRPRSAGPDAVLVLITQGGNLVHSIPHSSARAGMALAKLWVDALAEYNLPWV